MPEIQAAIESLDVLPPTESLRDRLSVALTQVDFLRAAIRLGEKRDKEREGLTSLLACRQREVQHATA
jgi:hypothetical protein